MGLELILLSAVIFLFAGTIKGTVGIGLPTASISILSQMVPPHTAIALVIFPMLISNGWQVLRSGAILATVKRFWPFALLLAVSIYISTGYSASLSPERLMLVLGGVIVVFSLTSLFVHPPRLPERFDRLGQIVGGSLAGVMGGLTAIWSPPMVIYLLARQVQKDDFVRACGVLILAGSVPLLAGYWQHGLMTGPLALTSCAMIVPTLAGFSLGEHIRKRIDHGLFQKLVLGVFLVMGLNIIRRVVF